MSLQPLIPGLVVVMVASIAMLVWAVGENARDLTLIASLAFPAAAVLVALIVNRVLPKGQPIDEAHEPIFASRRNARLMAMIYAWGAAAIFAVYSLTQLWWWHSWQYGSAMAFIACGLLIYVNRMENLQSPLVQPRMLDAAATLALIQAGAIVVGLAFLIASGKLGSTKPDWPANYVFVGGGVGLMLISLIAARTHRKLRHLTERTAHASPRTH